MKRMKIDLKNTRLLALQKRVMTMVGVLLLCGAPSETAFAAGNDSVALTFTYTVTEGTCDVDVKRATLPFGIVSDTGETRDALDKSWFFIGINVLNIDLTGCAGSGMTGSNIPVIKVTGFNTATSGSADKKKYMMMPMNPATPPTGLGMVISQKDKSITQGAGIGNLSAITGNTMYIDVGTTNAVLPATTTTVKLNAALACGTAADCTSALLNPGKENMTLTFSFGYR